MQHPPCGCRRCDHRPPPCPPMRPPRPQPCPKPPGDRILVQKIVASDRRDLPCLCTDLVLDTLPPCARPPFHLLSVQPGPTPPVWQPMEDQPGCGRFSASITLSVCVRLQDADGTCWNVSGTVQLETWLPRRWLNDSREKLMILPSLCLLSAEPGCEGSVFHVQLRVTLELYVLRLEPCLMRRPQPACPELPLYPPPPQPCGWPC